MPDRHRRQLERAAAESGANHDKSLLFAENIRSGRVSHENTVMAAIAGSEEAKAIIDEDLPSFENVHDWALFFADNEDSSLRLREAYGVLSKIRASEKRRMNDDEDDINLFDQTMRLAREVMQDPNQERVQAFLEFTAERIPTVSQDTLSGNPTTGSLPAILILFRSMIRYEYDNNSEEIEPNAILINIIDLAMNENFGAGLSEKEVKHAIRDELVSYLLRPKEL